MEYFTGLGIGIISNVANCAKELKLTFTQMDKKELKESSKKESQFIWLNTDKMEQGTVNSGMLSGLNFTRELTILTNQEF